MTEHMFILDPPRPRWMPKFWSPWNCLCGTGGTGYDDDAAQRQFDLHMMGAWPALTEWAPGFHPFVKPDGETVYVKDED